MTILALDLGTKTGWAVKSVDLVSGTHSFKTNRFEGGGMRYLRFERWLQSMQRQFEFTEIYYEEVRRHVSTQAGHVYGGFEATLTKFCEEHAIPYSSVPVGAIKLNATGKGNASKGRMIYAARCLGHDVIDDNEADAIHLLNYVYLSQVCIND